MIIDSKGLSIDTLEDIYDRIQNKYKEIFGLDINIDTDTPDGQLIGLFSQEIYYLQQTLGFVLQMLDPVSAQGTWLENICLMNGIIRRKGKPSYLSNIEFQGNPNTKIKADEILKDQTGEKWILQSDVIINENGVGLGACVSENIGSIILAKGAKLELLSVILGIKKITVLQDSIPGVEAETDKELRARFFLTQELTGNNIKRLENQIKEIENVRDCIIYENRTGIVDNLGISPHSINIVVLGGNAQKIAEVIYANKSIGCGLHGDIHVTIDRDNIETTISFDRPSAVNVTVNIVIERRNKQKLIDNQTIIDQVKAIQFNLAKNVYTSDIIKQITISDAISIKQMRVNNQDSIAINSREYAIIDKVIIDVE